jgi:hypothetical protein
MRRSRFVGKEIDPGMRMAPNVFNYFLNDFFKQGEPAPVDPLNPAAA